jgi:hypothetical protein
MSASQMDSAPPDGTEPNVALSMFARSRSGRSGSVRRTIATSLQQKLVDKNLSQQWYQINILRAVIRECRTWPKVTNRTSGAGFTA